MKRFILLFILFCLLLGLTSVYMVAQTNYRYDQLQMEQLGRGVVAIRENASTVAISWRYFSSDPLNTTFNIYRNGEKVNTKPITSGTIFHDKNKSMAEALYEVRPVVEGKETGHKNGSYILPENAPVGYIDIPLQKPEDGVTPMGDKYTYSPNDASIGDVDGDGEYEIILKWDPGNSKDNAHDGYTGDVYIDCYRLSGELLWRINLGKNIRAGAHYTPFLVYDLDNDGKAEVVVRTADGTIDGKGNIIGDPEADYREVGEYYTPRKKKDSDEIPEKALQNHGRVWRGKDYLTVFSGLTGEALHTIEYIPQRGNPSDWGDNRANRSDRFLAGVAYLDGVRPSVVMCRGYYTRTVIAAFDWNGKELTNRWTFDTNEPGNEKFAGQGNHSLAIGDIDGDGCDEIVYGSCTIDHDGKGLYSTGLGHGDAMHLTQFDPANSTLQVWACHENKKDGSTFRDAATGKILFQIPSGDDVGRCIAADIDPTNPGLEMWSSRSGGIRNIQGKVLAEVKRMPINMAIWWDGDLLREMLDKTTISKYNWREQKFENLVTFEGVTHNNGSKGNPCLQADMIGDWREEVLYRTPDNTALRLYVSTIPTKYRFHTFLEDPVYRLSIVTQNIGYNQPTQPGFYFGPDLKGTFRGYVFTR